MKSLYFLLVFALFACRNQHSNKVNAHNIYDSTVVAANKISKADTSTKVLSKWNGHYTVYIASIEQINNITADVAYELNIYNDSCAFSASGVQYFFSDQCTLKEANDTLYGTYSYQLDGYDTYHDKINPLFRIYKKEGKYFIISTVIYTDNDAKEVELTRDK